MAFVGRRKNKYVRHKTSYLTPVHMLSKRQCVAQPLPAETTLRNSLTKRHRPNPLPSRAAHFFGTIGNHFDLDPTSGDVSVTAPLVPTIFQIRCCASTTTLVT